MKRALKRHFTAVYYLTEPEVTFDTSMVVWSMFYYRTRLKGLSRKFRVFDKLAIDRINAFFGENHNPLQILYVDEHAAEKARVAARRTRLPAR